MDDATRRSLMEAGAAAIPFNAPLGAPRVDELVDFVADHGHSVVDLGCGAGALVVEGAGFGHPVGGSRARRLSRRG